MTKVIIEHEFELSRPTGLWILHNKWFCVEEVIISKKTYEDDSVEYTVETADYREIATVNGGYQTALGKIETYYDDNSTVDYELEKTFTTYEEAFEYVEKEYPAIDLEKELDKHYEE